MSLSDYSTAEEKIAALKCALMDPDLVYFESGTLNVSETIYLATHNITLNGIKLYNFHDSSGMVPPKITSGNTLIPGEVWSAFLYIKDSDINYSDPITLYKDRLVKITEAEYKHSTGLTVGSNGALLIATIPNEKVNIDGKSVVGSWGWTSIPFATPFKSGYVLSGTNFDYIDLPADW